MLFEFGMMPNVHATFFGGITGDQAVCRLTNYSSECAPSDTPQPWYLDWGSTVTLPATPLYGRYPDLQLYPTCASAVVPIYNLNGKANLVLTMQTLAKIWSGRITTWDHPEIQATNANFASWNIPANKSIILVARADSAGSTQLFKKSLAAIDPVFKSQIGTAGAPVWAGTKVTFQATPQFIIAFIMRTPYTLGYAPPGDALGSDIPMARLNRSGVVVEASTASVQYALLEKGLSFGNNGDSPSHLTADIFNALNPLAWPIASYSYLAVRKATLRPGATCTSVATMMNFWLWFWSSSEVATLASALGFSVLPEVVRDFAVARFQQDIQCEGSLVWQQAEVPVVAGYGPESAIAILDKFQQAYALVNSSVTLNYTTLTSDQTDMAPLLRSGGFLVSATPPSTPGVFSLALGSEAVVSISQFRLTLDGRTLARVLNGDIKTWLHPEILALNPAGIRTAAGQVLNDTNQSIVLLQGPTAGSAPLTALLRQFYPAYTGAAIQAAERLSREMLVWTAVLGTPYSFAVTTMVGQLPGELQLASIISAGGAAVAPTLDAFTACTTSATYDATGKGVVLSSASSSNSSCYPLLLTLYVSLQRQCPAPPSTARAVVFLQWMFDQATLDAALNALNLVSLSGASSAIQAANSEALFQLSCQTRPVPTTPTDLLPLLLAIIIPIAVVVLLGLAACGWWLWRVTEYNRMLRKKFSNDNVAESCAEAIARFDLAAVEWLKEVREPNKIQLAFLAIIALLTEVKPYIPDQLLSRLTASTSKMGPGEEAENEAEQRSEQATPLGPEGPFPDTPQQPPRHLAYTPRSARSQNSSIPSIPSSHSRPTHRSASTSEGAKQVSAMRDWSRRRCTYLSVRLGSHAPPSERRLMALAQAAGRVVDAAKANGATIDSVGLDVVNVHWGVASASTMASTRAVQAALEIARLGDTLPEDQQAAFWLQVGIGKGLAECGTVSSASGHRFFVVSGPEVSLAVEIASSALPKRVLASLLVSPAVYQEVQYTVHCMPRLWHGEALLWEPLFVLKKKGDDEWMYELQTMHQGATLTSKVVLEAFVLAKSEGASVGDVVAHVAQLRVHHGGRLSPSDATSLDLLLVSARARPSGGQGMALEDVAA
eukprot:EG_transcript_840